MHMWFWFGTDLGSFLFPEYKVLTAAGLITTCFCMIALAIVYEGMKTVQIKLHRRSKAAMVADASRNTENSNLLSRIVPGIPRGSASRWKAIGQWSLEVVHYSIHNTLGYILMLAAMTYNIWICFALVVGGAVGYFIFGPLLMDLNLNELRQTYNVISCEPECSDAIIPSVRRQSTVSIVAEQLISEVNAEIHATSES